jgi:hypothetical protein
MAEVIKYRLPDEPKYYIKDWLVKIVFETGALEQNDEWMNNEFYNRLLKMMPPSVDIDDDAPGWYDVDNTLGEKDAWHLVLHGADENQEKEPGFEDEPGPAMAFIGVYISLKSGRVYKVETEGLA